MPRKPRDAEAGGVYHVWARGNRKEDIFFIDEDRREYLLELGLVARELEWRMLAFCLMTNHVHLLVELTKPNLSDGIRMIHGPYARGFNERHQTGGGHLFQKRFGCNRAMDEGAVLYIACYVLLNPVRAGFCTRPEAYEWSSCAAMLGKAITPRWLHSDRLLARLTGAPADRIVQFSQMLEAVRIFRAAGLDGTLGRGQTG